MPTGTGAMILLSMSFQRACLTGSLKWKSTGIGLCLGFRDCPLCKVNMGSRAGNGWEYSVFIECCLDKFFQEPALKFVNVIFCCKKRRVLGVIW